MTVDGPDRELWHRVLILAPIGRDADLIASVFGDAGIAAHRCNDAGELCALLKEGAGAVIIAEEALDPNAMALLNDTLQQQPPWSDMPVLILTGQPLSIPLKPRSFTQIARHASITLVDRPVRMKSLVTTAESLLRFRSRQYEVRELMHKLEDRIHERDRFLAILGHELRNPLAAILLATQMAEDDGRLEAEHVRRIEQQSKHLTRLVNDLLDLSRVTSGKIVLRNSLVNFSEAVQQVIDTVGSLMREQKLTLTFDCPEEALFVDGDPVRLDQIVTNVLTNAMKYTPDGGQVQVVLACTDDEVLLKVSDTGVGIAPERIGGIFQLFAQAENAIGRAQGGMGIGLALVKNLTELHGGSVTAESDGVGKGSTFTVRLPRAEAPDAAAFVKPVSRASAPANGDGARRIVVVEDNDDLRDLLRMRLKRLGHDVEVAPDGERGVEMLISEKPDVAFVDIGLPGLDGYGVAQKVREVLGDSIFLVALSGFGQPDDKRKALEAGFNQHLTKPAEMQDIERVLERRE